MGGLYPGFTSQDSYEDYTRVLPLRTVMRDMRRIEASILRRVMRNVAHTASLLP